MRLIIDYESKERRLDVVDLGSDRWGAFASDVEGWPIWALNEPSPFNALVKLLSNETARAGLKASLKF